MARAVPHQRPRAWQVYIECCHDQVPVCSLKRSFEGGEAGEGGRGKNFADMVP